VQFLLWVGSLAKNCPTQRAAPVLKVKSKTIFLAGRLRPVHEMGRVSPIGDDGACRWATPCKIIYRKMGKLQWIFFSFLAY
jgi:hypothetical protein